MHLDSPVSLNVKINFTQQSGAKKMAKYVQKDITLEPYFKYVLIQRCINSKLYFSKVFMCKCFFQQLLAPAHGF